jgi:hypothetical protein
MAKLDLTEMGSRSFFITTYIWLEKYFSRGDYLRERVHRASDRPSSSFGDYRVPAESDSAEARRPVL